MFCVDMIQRKQIRKSEPRPKKTVKPIVPSERATQNNKGVEAADFNTIQGIFNKFFTLNLIWLILDTLTEFPTKQLLKQAGYNEADLKTGIDYMKSGAVFMNKKSQAIHNGDKKSKQNASKKILVWYFVIYLICFVETKLKTA